MRDFFCSNPQDVKELHRRIDAAVTPLGFRRYLLGSGMRLYTNYCDPQKPTILFTAGFHGEEPGGPWGLVHYFETTTLAEFPPVNFSFIPVVNPSGMATGSRLNSNGEMTNAGFVHQTAIGDYLSEEGIILASNIDGLKIHGRDAFISLHEDVTAEGSFVYTFEDGDEPTKRSTIIASILGQEYPLVRDGTKLKGGGDPKSGIIFRMCDGSLEDRMYHEGTGFSACTELPAMPRFKFEDRARSYAQIIGRISWAISKDSWRIPGWSR